MTEVEHELKFLTSEADFLQLIKSIECRYPEAIKKDKLQINYYYDSFDNYLNKQGITCRIRQIGGALRGQIKRHCDVKNFESTEMDFTVEELPQIIKYEKQILPYQGNLVTLRSSYQIHPKIKIECDVNYYLGWRDFEVEVEYELDAYNMAKQIVCELEMKESNLICKSERFFILKSNMEKQNKVLLGASS